MASAVASEAAGNFGPVIFPKKRIAVATKVRERLTPRPALASVASWPFSPQECEAQRPEDVLAWRVVCTILISIVTLGAIGVALVVAAVSL